MSAESAHQSTFHPTVKHAVLTHINTGLDNAISTPDLATKTNQSLSNESVTPSKVRDVISELRSEGLVIISKRGHGYYRPRDREEFSEYVTNQLATIQNQRENLQALVRAYYGTSGEVFYDG